MKKQFVIGVMYFGLLSANVLAKAGVGAEDVSKMIQQASAALLNPSSSGEQIQGALIRLLDAAAATLPKSARVSEVRSNLEAAKADLKGHSLFSEKGHQHLALAYRALNSGKDFQFPEIRSIEDAKVYAQKLVAASIAGIEKGPDSPTSRLLLECVLLVVTPIAR